ncbi:hypothetical protein [Pseudomonas amygdali]|nr:hypothetical protein [Pseudomonas amygdali]
MVLTGGYRLVEVVEVLRVHRQALTVSMINRSLAMEISIWPLSTKACA